MSWKQLIGAGTWLGAAVAAAVLLAGLGIGSLVLLRGMLPESAMRPIVWAVSALACFCGGRVAVRKGNGGPLPRALAVSACVYGAMWLTALTGESDPQFAAGGIAQTCAVWGGGLLAGAIGAKRKRKKAAYPRRKRNGDRRKRAVT